MLPPFSIRFRSRLIRLCAAAQLAAGLGSSGCRNELADCDPEAAQELVFSRQGMVATKGQALLHDSCGNSAFCHSSAAKNGERYGVPAGLDFDMLPAPTGWPRVIEWREEIWEAVVDGAMPPGAMGEKVHGDGDWRSDWRRSEDASALPKLSTHDGKAALRNWLACDAPLVSKTTVPLWARPNTVDPAEAAGDFDALYEAILAPNCATTGCHDRGAAGGLEMSDACRAFESLKKTGACGSSRVQPGDPDSLLLDKVGSRSPACGGPMPPAGSLSEAQIMALRAWVEGGAEAPASCK